MKTKEEIIEIMREIKKERLDPNTPDLRKSFLKAKYRHYELELKKYEKV